MKKARKAKQEEAPAAAASGAEGQGAAAAASGAEEEGAPAASGAEKLFGAEEEGAPAASGAVDIFGATGCEEGASAAAAAAGAEKEGVAAASGVAAKGVPAAADLKRAAGAGKQSGEKAEKRRTLLPPAEPAKPSSPAPSPTKSKPETVSKPAGGGTGKSSKMLDIPAQRPLRLARPSEQAISNGSSGTVREWIAKIEPSVIWRLSMFLNTHKDVKLDKPLYALQCPPITDDKTKAVHSFKEPMNFANLMSSCKTTGLYEAGAPIWGIDTMRKQYKGFKSEDPSWVQLSVAESFFSAEALLQSNVNNEKFRRFIIPGIIPIAAESMAVVERQAREVGGLRGWPACGGLVVIWALLARLDEALENNDVTMILKLYEASLTATVRVRIDPEQEQLILDSIQSAETLRVLNLSGATDSFWTLVKDLTGLEEFDPASGGSGPAGGGKQMLDFLQKMGIRWKGKACDKKPRLRCPRHCALYAKRGSAQGGESAGERHHEVHQ